MFWQRISDSVLKISKIQGTLSGKPTDTKVRRLSANIPRRHDTYPVVSSPPSPLQPRPLGCHRLSRRPTILVKVLNRPTDVQIP